MYKIASSNSVFRGYLIQYKPTLFYAVTELQSNILKSLLSSYSTSKALSLRAEIILLSVENLDYEIMKLRNLTRKTINKWNKRWLKFSSKLSVDIDEHKMKKLIIECLSDSARSGRPSTYSVEEVTKIFHLACTVPTSINIPLSHWSTRSLAQYLVNNKVVEKISHERVAFFLKMRN